MFKFLLTILGCEMMTIVGKQLLRSLLNFVGQGFLLLLAVLFYW